MLKGRFKGLYLRCETYWFAKQINGRRSHVSLETTDYVEAVQRAREILDRPELQPAQSLKAEIKRFLKHKYETNRFSKMSAEAKESVLNMFAESVKNVPPANVTTYLCKAFYNASKARVAPSTAESYMFTVRSFFNWCVAENVCRRNPALEVQLDRVDHKGRTRFTDLETAQRLIENAPSDDLRFILFCGFHTGMRKLEIVESVPEWFNLRAKTLEIRTTATFRPKDRDARTVPLTDQFVDFLKGYGLRSPYVLQPDVVQGKHRYRFVFRRAFSDYMKVQGVPWISPHVMRHSFASICASKGIDIYRIATWLGDDVRVVQKHYAKLRPDDREIMRAFKV
ncbi:MAG: tyrosine-type recombinase/integrase [Chthoniobacteraceae bacterium]